MARGELAMARCTVPVTTAIVRGDVVPTLIEWPDSRHPTDRMTDSGTRLTAIAGEHPEPLHVRTLLATLGLSDTLKVTYAQVAAPRRDDLARRARVDRRTLGAYTRDRLRSRAARR